MTTAAQMRGRTAVVTGASTGIGAEIAERLAGYGAHLVLVARTAERLHEAAERLRKEHGVKVLVVPLDLAVPDAPRRLARKLAEEGIEVEMLVNNAGIGDLAPVAESDPARVRMVVDVNAGALAETTALLLPQMVMRDHGSVINIASTGAYAPAPYLAAYAASKAFVLSFTQALWAETTTSGVRVVAVSPGPTETPMNTRPAPGKRHPRDVADTALKALSGRRSAVVDGRVNALTSFAFGRLLSAQLSARIAERFMRRTLPGK
jgi:short-subunit dehydrogenase